MIRIHLIVLCLIQATLAAAGTTHETRPASETRAASPNRNFCMSGSGVKIECALLDETPDSKCVKVDAAGRFIGLCCSKDSHCGVGFYCAGRGCGYFRPGYCYAR